MFASLSHPVLTLFSAVQSIMCNEGSAVDDSDAAVLMQQIEKLAKELAAKDSKHVKELKTMISMMDDS